MEAFEEPGRMSVACLSMSYLLAKTRARPTKNLTKSKFPLHSSTNLLQYCLVCSVPQLPLEISPRSLWIFVILGASAPLFSSKGFQFLSSANCSFGIRLNGTRRGFGIHDAFPVKQQLRIFASSSGNPRAAPMVSTSLPSSCLWTILVLVLAMTASARNCED